MGKRGPKSAASLTVAAVRLPGARPKPLAELTDAEAACWRQTVATKPADYFTADSWPLLAAYCRAVATSTALGAKIAEMTASALAGGDPFEFAMLDKLLAMRDREGKAINAFMRSMRLTHQSRIEPRGAATAHKSANGRDATPKAMPWDFK